jgi:hypothetical protein
MPRKEKADRECRSDVQRTTSSPGCGYEVKTLMKKPDRKRTGLTRPNKGITIVFAPQSGLGEEQVGKLNRDEGK